MATFHVSGPMRTAMDTIKSAAADDNAIASLLRIAVERADDPERQHIISEMKRNKSAFAALGVDDDALAMLSKPTLRKLSARLAANSKLPAPRRQAPRVATVSKAVTVPARGAGRGFQASASKDPGTRSFHSRADSKRAAAFEPESSLTAFLRLNGRDTTSADAMLAEQASRRARAASYEPAPRGTPQVMTASDRRRAAAFIPPSSLDVYRARQTEGPAEDNGVTRETKSDDRQRDFADHQAEMRAIAQGKKPATRSAPRSDRPGYSRG